MIGVGCQIVLARTMTVSGFGGYAFAISLLQFAAMFFEFGLFVPAARLAAKGHLQFGRLIVGAAFLMYLPIGFAFAGLVAVLSLWVDSWFNVQAGAALLICAPLAVAFPFPFLAQQLAQGTTRLHVFSLTYLLGQVLFLASLAIVTAPSGLVSDLSTTLALALRSTTLIACALIAVWWLRPKFRGAWQHSRTLIQHARGYGFQIYVGRVLSIGTYNMDVLMLGAFTNAHTVAVYALARTLAAAVGLPTAGAAAALFPRMTSTRGLRRQWLTVGWSIGVVLVLMLSLAGEPLVQFLFAPALASTARYIPPLAIAEGLRGITSVYNSYLSAQGLGRELRNAGIVLTVSNLMLNVALIPPYGAAGAAWASVLALLANLLAHIIGYRRSLSRAQTLSSCDMEQEISSPLSQ
jgi:O-antigen/teichoic acid export membrane protein